MFSVLGHTFTFSDRRDETSSSAGFVNELMEKCELDIQELIGITILVVLTMLDLWVMLLRLLVLL